jgi:hypothetical protein
VVDFVGRPVGVDSSDGPKDVFAARFLRDREEITGATEGLA